MEKVNGFPKQADFYIEGQMPRLEIICGDPTTHEEIVILAFIDSRHNFGAVMPRFDLPEPPMNAEFAWDYYRQDIGTSNVIPPKGETKESRVTTGYKSGEKVFDTAEFITLECRRKIWVATKGLRRQKQCHSKIRISRADWNEIGRLLIEAKEIEPSPKTKRIPLNQILQMRKLIQEKRNKADRETKRHADN